VLDSRVRGNDDGTAVFRALRALRGSSIQPRASTRILITPGRSVTIGRIATCWQDFDDVRAMLGRELVDPRRALAYFEQVEPELYRFPAIDAPSFRRAVEAAFAV